MSFDLSAYATRDLLVDSYRTRIFQVFIPTTIAGAPAVLQKSNPSSTICTATVGVGDGQSIESTWYGSARDDTDSCADAMRVVEAVVGNLPPLR